jgi:hypothetical protein
MTNDLEILIGEASPRVTRRPEAFLAALDVSDEAAAITRTTKKHRRSATVIGATAVLVLAGTTAAAAAAQTLWWTAPHEVVVEAVPITADVSPVTRVGFILSADYAPGVDGSSISAQSAFQLAQRWLAEHPVVVPVPAEAQSLTETERHQAVSAGVPPQSALERKASNATNDARVAAIAAGLDGLVADLTAYLEDNGADPALVIVDAENGVFQVGP